MEHPDLDDVRRIDWREGLEMGSDDERPPRIVSLPPGTLLFCEAQTLTGDSDPQARRWLVDLGEALRKAFLTNERNGEGLLRRAGEGSKVVSVVTRKRIDLLRLDVQTLWHLKQRYRGDADYEGSGLRTAFRVSLEYVRGCSHRDEQALLDRAVVTRPTPDAASELDRSAFRFLGERVLPDLGLADVCGWCFLSPHQVSAVAIDRPNDAVVRYPLEFRLRIRDTHLPSRDTIAIVRRKDAIAQVAADVIPGYRLHCERVQDRERIPDPDDAEPSDDVLSLADSEKDLLLLVTRLIAHPS